MAGRAEAAVAAAPTFESAAEVAAVVRPLMRAIAAAVGPHCEVVLHDLAAHQGRRRDLERSIIAIENGSVTGRSVGGPSTNLGFHVIHDEGADHDAFGYRGRTADGREVSCSSIYYRNSAGRIVAALCINVDLSRVTQAQRLIEALVPPVLTDSAQTATRQSQDAVTGEAATRDVPTRDGSPSEIIGQDIASMLDALITEAIRAVGRPVELMTRADRVDVVRQLEERGALHVKRAVERISTRLGVSRVTTYAYLEEIRNDAARRRS